MPRAPLILSSLAVGLLAAPLVVQASGYRYLCTSTRRVCEYTGPDAPYLNADVCYGSASGVVLKGIKPCPTGTWPYHVEHGEVVDPITNTVAAYVPLDDACSQPGLCIDGPPPAGAQEHPMCCTSDSQGNETCYDGASCGGTLWWCADGVCNDDGTITCFAKEEL